ncbi:MAG TPA: helix-turn-helix transcriptional regulator [Holophaga sp.]|nr:helix-turn-helix transcriptional regulator [Holophaga sp.]
MNRPAGRGPYGLDVPSGQPRSLGDRVRKIRKAWRWTQRDIAERLNLQTASVSAWERGVALPTGSSLVSLAALLNTSPEVLKGDAPFSIPDQPQGVAEPQWKAYQLPLPTDRGQTLLVKEGSALRAVPAKELRGLALEAIEEGRPVWLVIGHQEKA